MTEKRSTSFNKAAFTLVEVVVATACASIMFGAVLMSSLALQRTLKATESYSSMHSANQRLMDYMATDLRGAVAIGARRDSTGTVATLSSTNSWLSLLSGTTFVIKKVTVYKSVDRSADNSTVPWELRATNSGITYCTGTGVPPRTVVEYSRSTIGSTEYIVRKETAPSLSDEGTMTTQSTSDIVYSDSADVDVDLTLTGSSFGATVIDIYYPNQFSRSVVSESGTISSHGANPLIKRSWGVVSSDNIMLRNPREDQ